MSETVRRPDHPHTAEDLLPARLRRFGTLLAAAAVGVTLVGFLTGIREPRQAERPRLPERREHAAARPAVAYAELPEAKLGPNAKSASILAALVYDRPGILDPVVRTEEMKLAALADRARNRAYDGAPPTIPHPVDSRSAASCLACHGAGLKVGDRVASRVSHAHLSSCTQCHAEQLPAGPLTASAPPANDFAGLVRSGPGDRASPGAPPTIPHHTLMREDCTSCHGLVTRPGTRTTHPWLSNCTQCHAPSAFRDQVDFLGAPR